MTLFLSSILIIIFLFLSGLHIYWAFGGKWGSEAVIPTTSDDKKAVMPGIVPTLIVALGLLGFAVVIFLSSFYSIVGYGLWVIAFIFIVRAIGEFRYLGFFKKHKNTKFAHNDTKIYSPLCLFIGVVALFLRISQLN